MTQSKSGIKKFMKGFSFTFSANFISLIVSVLTIMIVPKFLGVRDYGYYQLYVFYVSYVGMLHLGWNDGVYLKYGGKYYDELDKPLLKSQVILSTLMYAIISLILLLTVSFLNIDVLKRNLLFVTMLTGLIINPRGMIYFIFQATGRLKEYSIAVISGRITFIIVYLLFFVLGFKTYKSLILSEIIGHIVPLLSVVYFSKDIFLSKISDWKSSFNEAINNINIGYKLMIANIASQLIIGINRFFIDQRWGITVFSKVSLTLSISNLVLVFVNSVGIVMFPMLRRAKESKLSEYYETINNIMMPLLLSVLICYMPIKVVMSAWLPNYSDSLEFMGIIFPIIIYESKMSLLVNSYLRTLRREKDILKINVMSVLLSSLLSFIFVYLFESIHLAILGIVLTIAFRCIIAEIFLSKLLNINLKDNILWEVLLVFVFIFTNMFFSNWISTISYIMIFSIYIYFNFGKIKNEFIKIKIMLRNR